jgi:Ca-activated chloride channel homolog
LYHVVQVRPGTVLEAMTHVPAVLKPAVHFRGRWGRAWAPCFVIALSVLTVRLPAQFATGVQVVEVYATVTRPDGSAVTGLTAADFEVLEDGVPQPVSLFVAGEFPLTVALGVDRSFSMAGEPLRLAMRASQVFLRELKPADRSMVWAISEEADVVAPLGAPRDEQLLALAKLTPWSTTALHDGVIAALERLEPEPGRQALVLFTDGIDRYSRASIAQVIERVRRSNALVYGIGLGKTRAPILVEMAAVSGGRSIQVRDVAALEPALASVARELRHQYLLGYAPPKRPAEGPRWRSITVRLKTGAGAARVRARDGYVAR